MRHAVGVGRYQLQGEIARGGMGAILRGRDVDLGRELAIKVLLETHQGDPAGDPPLHRRSADRRPVAASRYRAGLRAGNISRPPSLFRHEAGQGPDAGGACSTNGPIRVHDLPRLLGDLRAGLPDDGLCPRARRDPPRLEAVERDGRLIRRGAGDGLGPGQGACPSGGVADEAAGAAGPGKRHQTVRRARPEAAASRRPAACWAHPRTWRRSRPAATLIASTCDPMPSAWERSCAKS